MKLVFPLIVTILFLVAFGSAQQSSVTVEPFFPAAGEPPTPINLPLPKRDPKEVYPAGVITVAVTIDEKGLVTSVDDGDGPYPVCKNANEPRVLALRASAVAAAKQAKFKPATFESRIVAATGVLRYNFPSATEKDSPTGEPQEMRLDRLTILGTADKGVAPIGGEDGNSGSGEIGAGKAQSLPKPSYPAAAKAVRAGGTVGVQVIIAEDGTLYSATAISGHPLLRRAAEVAACAARFSPTMLSGQPVKVSGIINYNFVP